MQKVKLPPRTIKLEPKQRVCLLYAPSRKGTVVRVGPEVSEVRWDDKSNQIYHCNKQLRPIGEKQQ